MIAHNKNLTPMFGFATFDKLVPFKDDDNESKRCIGIWRTQIQESKSKLIFSVIETQYSYECIRCFRDFYDYLDDINQRTINFGPVLYEIYLHDLKVVTIRKPCANKPILRLVEHSYVPERITKLNVELYCNHEIQESVINLLEEKFQRKIQKPDSILIVVRISCS
jgi:hypothetical protein